MVPPPHSPPYSYLQSFKMCTYTEITALGKSGYGEVTLGSVDSNWLMSW